MIIRKQYLNGDITHREYYAQFLDSQTAQELLNVITLKEILDSTDPYLNDIPLKKWDSICNFQFSSQGQLVSSPTVRKELAERIKETGEGISVATMVCIYKEQARQLIEKHNLTITI